MKLKNMMIVVICVLGGSRVHAQSFDQMVETVSVELKPSMAALQAGMNKKPEGFTFAAAANTGQGGLICAGDRVIVLNFGAGRVMEVFKDGTAKVDLDDWLGYKYLSVAALGKGVGCARGLCRDDRVFDSRFGSGKAVEVFSNGMAKIDFDAGWWRYKYLSISGLSVGSPCTEGGRDCSGR